MAKRSRCADMKDRRSAPLTEGGISVPEFDRLRGWGEEAEWEVAALTAEASRE